MIRLTVPDIHPSDIEAVREVLTSGFLVQGQQVRAFEEALERYLGVEGVVAVGSGTAALHLALVASGVGIGDEVLVSDYTFPATANAVIHAGAIPVLVDIERESFNMDPDAARECLSPQTKAILLVHAFGRPANLPAFRSIANEAGLVLIEDAACALGSRFGSDPCGTLGRAGCFSFHPRKNITTAEGGAVVSEDPALCKQVRSLRSHGAETSGSLLRFTAAGFNYRMTEIGAVLGRGQLLRLDDIVARKAERVAEYRRGLAGLDGVTVLRPFDDGSECHQSFVVVVDDPVDRDAVIRQMREEGVETTIGTYALHREPLFRSEYGYGIGQLPVSDWAFRKALTLPLYPAMTTDQVTTVCGTLGRVLGSYGGGS